MNWLTLTLIGAPVNAVTNLGYKLLSNASGLFFFTALIFLVAAALVYLYGRRRYGHGGGYLLTGRLPWLVLGMGVGTMLIMLLFLSAFTHGGPISLVDPLLACSYAVVSVGLGIGLLRERPSRLALLGMLLYLAGAALMAFG